jgi:hypothetical protein
MSGIRGERPGEHSEQPSELYVVELDERLEFGAAIIDSDLQADDNTGCKNDKNCYGTNPGCNNADSCGNGTNGGCNNTSC